MTLRDCARAAAAAAAVGLALAGAAHAQSYERPTSFSPSGIPGIKPSGSNYAIASPVVSDGFMRIYTFKSAYGDFAAIGDALAQTRIVELAALAELERVSNSDSFRDALTQAGLSPIKYAGAMVTNPGQTISNTLSGIGSLFGRVNASMNNMGKTPDNAVQNLLGVTEKRRELATHLGVDPYTDFEPLAAKLSQLSEAAAAGGLVVTGALMAIPGVGGIVVSNVATTSKVSDLARDLSAAQLMDLNRRKLGEMGVEKSVAETLLTNRAFTPFDVTVIVTSLESMPGVQNRGAFVARAAEINRHDAAFFMRRQAELLADYYAKSGTLTGFVTLGGYPFNVTRGGAVVGILPLDALSWTENTARSMKNIVSDARSAGYAGRAEMRITGQATPMAKKALKDLGWTVVDNFRS